MFYYVQRVCDEIIKEFEPRIPDCRMMGENEDIKRICLSKTIEGCINAAPWGHDQLVYRKENEVFRLYSFNDRKIPKENKLCSRELYHRGYVDDAVYTKEIWVLNQTLKPTKIQYFKIGEMFEEESVDIMSYAEKCDYRQTGIFPYTASFMNILRNLDIQMLDEKDLFIGKVFEIPEGFLEWKLDDALPTEAHFDYSDDGKFIIFENEVVFCLDDVKKECD